MRQSVFDAKKLEDAKGLPWREGEAIEPEGIARLDHDFACGVIVSAAAARGTRHARDMVATAGNDHDHAIPGDTKPGRSFGEPRPGIDTGKALEAELRVGLPSGLAEEKFAGWAWQGGHVDSLTLVEGRSDSLSPPAPMAFAICGFGSLKMDRERPS